MNIKNKITGTFKVLKEGKEYFFKGLIEEFKEDKVVIKLKEYSINRLNRVTQLSKQELEERHKLILNKVKEGDDITIVNRKSSLEQTGKFLKRLGDKVKIECHSCGNTIKVKPLNSFYFIELPAKDIYV